MKRFYSYTISEKIQKYLFDFCFKIIKNNSYIYKKYNLNNFVRGGPNKKITHELSHDFCFNR